MALRAEILLRDERLEEALPLARAAADELLQSGGAPLMEFLPFAVLGETLCALSQPEQARATVLTALDRLRARLSQISRPSWRASYLALPEQARLRSLARALCPQELTNQLPEWSAAAPALRT